MTRIERQISFLNNKLYNFVFFLSFRFFFFVFFVSSAAAIELQTRAPLMDFAQLHGVCVKLQKFNSVDTEEVDEKKNELAKLQRMG